MHAIDTNSASITAARATVRRPRRIPLLRTLAVVVGVIALALGAPSLTSANAAPIAGSVSAVVRADGTAALSWQFTPDATRTKFDVFTYDLTTGTAAGWGNTWASKTATGAVITGLLPGRAYAFTVVARGATSTFAFSQTARLSNGACPWGVCSIADANATAGSAQRIAQGFLHTVTATTPVSLLKPLQTTSWRISPYDTARYTAAKAAGGTITMVLSDAWMINNWTGTRAARNPWQDWNAYTNFVTATVRWHQARGMSPDYWDIQNEPDAPNLYATTLPPTRALVLQQFRVGYAAIRQAQPSAKIVGPSLSNAAVDVPEQLTDFRSLLADAAANGIRYDAISWHENGYGPIDSFEGGSRAIAEHTSWVRQLLSDYGLGSPPLFVNEYGAQFAQGNPGSEVGYIAALERAGIASAAHSCFPAAGLTLDTCSDPRGLLDGLLTPLGLPTSAYWVHRDYASMTGTRIVADGNAPQLATFATRSASGELAALVGNDLGCNPAVDNTYCPVGAGLTLTPTFAVSTPTGGPSRYKLTVERMPYTNGPLLAPITVTSGTIVSVSNGSVTVTLPKLSIGDALFVRLTPA